MIKSKIKAALAHAIVTTVVALITASVVYLVWYPGDFARILNAVDLYLLILSVEVILGPVMTLVIYDTRKSRKELVKDYSVIAVIQLSALAYGMYSVGAARPVYTVFVKDRVEIVSANELEAKDIAAANPGFRSLSWLGPKTVCAEFPDDPVQKSDLLLSALKGKDIQLLPKYYRECSAGEINANTYEKPQLFKLTSITQGDLPEDLRTASFVWLPFVTRFSAGIVIYEDQNPNDPRYLGLDPFL